MARLFLVLDLALARASDAWRGERQSRKHDRPKPKLLIGKFRISMVRLLCGL